MLIKKKISFSIKSYRFFLKSSIVKANTYLSNFIFYNFTKFVFMFLLFRLQNVIGKKIFFNKPPHYFPFSGKTYFLGFYEPFVERNSNFFSRFYNANWIELKKNSISLFFDLVYFVPKRMEVLKSNIHKNKFEYKSQNDIVLPISNHEDDNLFKIKYENKDYNIKIPYNRFYYLKLKKNQNVTIENKSKFLVGSPLNLDQKNKNKTKITLGIFIDGIADIESINSVHNFSKIMPNTINFFKKGTIFKNHYANADWSLSSFPSIFTGCHIQKHHMYHPWNYTSLSEKIKTVTEFFNDSDYFCSHFGGNNRANPTHGYLRGYDRYVYQRSYNCEDIISDLLENLRAFDQRDHFSILELTDVHHYHYGLPDLKSQISDFPFFLDQRKKNEKTKASFFTRFSKVNNEFVDKSIYNTFNPEEIRIYLEELKALDHKLSLLYNFIEKNYNDDEFLISIFTDHGQSFFSKESNPLSFERRKIVWFLRGRDVNAGECDELTDNTDILKTLCMKSGIELNDKDKSFIDGIVPAFLGGSEKKDYVFSQSIYPWRQYSAVIVDEKYEFNFISKQNLEQIKQCTDDEFVYTLKNLKDGNEVNNSDKIKKYKNVCIEKIKEFKNIGI